MGPQQRWSTVRYVIAGVVLTLGVVTLGPSLSASGVPVSPSVESGHWTTITMPSNFDPTYKNNYFGADAMGNIYYVPTIRPPLLRSHTVGPSLPGASGGVVRFTPATGATTVLDPGLTNVWGITVEASGAVDAIVGSSPNPIVVHISPSGAQATIEDSIFNLGFGSGIAADGQGNVFVSTVVTPATVYEIPAGGGTPIPVGSVTGDVAPGLAVASNGTIYGAGGLSGPEVITSSGSTSVPFASYGYASDVATTPSGHVYLTLPNVPSVEDYAGTGTPSVLPASPALATAPWSQPTDVASGGDAIYMWDAGNGSGIGGVDTIPGNGTPNILYMWGTPGGVPRLTSVTSASYRVHRRYFQRVTATWTGTPGNAQCTLLYGFGSPSSFTVVTSARTCSFSHLKLGQSFGVSVVGWSGTPVTAPAVGFAPPARVTIRCARHHHVRVLKNRLLAVCPRGWHLK